MNKNFVHFSKCFLFLIAFTAFFGCKIVTEDSSTAQRPDIDNTSSTSIKVTLQCLSTDTKYISIYRQKEGSTSSVLIGQVFPDAFDSDNYSYLFEDKLVQKDTKYRYMARYYEEDNDTYYSTKWTEYYKAGFGASESSYKYTIGEKTLLRYSSEDCTIKFATSDSSEVSITNPTGIDDFSTNYKPAIAIRAKHDNYNLVQIFVFDENADKILAGTQAISLRGILPEGFYDCDLEIIGLIGQYTENNTAETPEPMRIYWTEPASIEVEGSINIPNSGASSGLDYSFPEDEPTEEEE